MKALVPALWGLRDNKACRPRTLQRSLRRALSASLLNMEPER